MAETLLLHTRTLCYGMLIGYFLTLVVRLFIHARKQKTHHARFVMRLASFTFAWLAFKNIIRFCCDMHTMGSSEYNPVLEHLPHILEMLAVPLLGVSVIALSRLKATNLREVVVVMLPLIIAAVLYIFIPDPLIEKLALCYCIGYAIVVIVCVHIYVKNYQKILNNTYANTSQRGVRWVLTTLYILVGVLSMWVISSFVLHSLLTECVYFILSTIPWTFYTYRLVNQNFNITDMHEVADDIEDDEEEIVVAEPATEPVRAQVATATPATPRFNIAGTSRVAVKAWQEPKFGEAIEKFCTDEKNFTNTDLSIIDVARGVNSNRTYVSRWCNEHGTDFSTYIINIRLDYAEQLLAKTNHSIADVVFMSGFSNSRHFRTVFFARHQCTPTEYRQRQAVEAGVAAEAEE